MPLVEVDEEILPGGFNNVGGPFNFMSCPWAINRLPTILRYEGRSLQILSLGQVFPEAWYR
jgi:hypothetical protein